MRYIPCNCDMFILANSNSVMDTTLYIPRLYKTFENSCGLQQLNPALVHALCARRVHCSRRIFAHASTIHRKAKGKKRCLILANFSHFDLFCMHHIVMSSYIVFSLQPAATGCNLWCMHDTWCTHPNESEISIDMSDQTININRCNFSNQSCMTHCTGWRIMAPERSSKSSRLMTVFPSASSIRPWQWRYIN